MSTKKKKKTIEDCRREHQRLAQSLAQLGFLWHGSVTSRTITCGNPNCACHTQPHKRHGPYTYWSTKVGGKTVSRKLQTAEAEVLDEWVQNRRRLKEITDQMIRISKEALPLTLKKRQKNMPVN